MVAHVLTNYLTMDRCDRCHSKLLVKAMHLVDVKGLKRGLLLCEECFRWREERKGVKGL